MFLVSINSNDFSRSQWYTIQCQFKTNTNEPAFVGKAIIVSEEVAFYDSRKKNIDTAGEDFICFGDSNYPLVISVFGVCSNTLGQLNKCQKCKEQDKTSLYRKRMRDDTWSYADRANNEKLLQILETGKYVIDASGSVVLRFRITCCVGARRQFHCNHVLSHNPNLERHRECLGISLTFEVKEGTTRYRYQYPTPIRVVGKANLTKQKETSSSQPSVPIAYSNGSNGSSGVIASPSPPSSNSTSKETSSTCEEIVPYREDTTTILTTSVPPIMLPIKPDNVNAKHVHELYRILGKNFEQYESLHRLCNNYLTRIGPSLRLLFQDIYQPQFFRFSNLVQIPPYSEQMLHVYNFLSICYLLTTQARGQNDKQVARIKSLGLKSKEVADKLVHNIKNNIDIPSDLLLLADGLARASILQVYQKNFKAVADLIDISCNLYECLAMQNPIIKDTFSYLFMMRIKICNLFSVNFLKDAICWSNQFSIPDLKPRLLTNLMFAYLYPFIEKGPIGYPFPHTLTDENLQQSLKTLLDSIDLAVEEAGYKDNPNNISIFASPRIFIEEAISAMYHWIMREIDKATFCVEKCALQIALVQNKTIDNVTLNIVCWVAVQIVGLTLQTNPCINDYLPRKQIEVAEVLLLASESGFPPWAKFVDELNRDTLNKFINLSSTPNS